VHGAFLMQRELTGLSSNWPLGFVETADRLAANEQIVGSWVSSWL